MMIIRLCDKLTTNPTLEDELHDNQENIDIEKITILIWSFADNNEKDSHRNKLKWGTCYIISIRDKL